MKYRPHRLAALAATAMLAYPGGAQAGGDALRGARAARTCMACHSFTPGQQMTGPSLAGVWERKAGSLAGFDRYSDALAHADFKWDEQHLDAWLKDPAALVPGNAMAFRGVPDARIRGDLIAYLKAVSTGRVDAPDNGLPDLKQADAASKVVSIQYCGDAYRVTTEDHHTRTFWEFNLRFKTDGSDAGPAAGKPVILHNGMGGDRAAVVFSKPEEISAFVKRQCT